MNFRSTIIAFALLLGMLWLFGLMLALHTGTLEKDLLLPTLHVASTAEIDQVTVERREGGADVEQFVFTKTKDKWRARVPPVKRTAPVENSRIEDMVRDIRDARQNREVSVRNDLAYYGLDKPALTVTLRGKEKKDGPEREWQVYIGKKSPDEKGFVYVNSSDRKGDILAVPQASLRSVFFPDVDDLRTHTLLDTTESSLQWLRLEDDKHTLELEKEGTNWRYLEPKFGYAEWQGPDAKKLGPVELAPDGVRGVASALAAVRVEKNAFVPLNDDDLGKYGLAPGSERLRIAISNDPKDKNKQTLFIGGEVPVKENRYYARLGDDESIVIVNGDKLQPVFKALDNPESLRSQEIVHVEAGKVDRILIRSGKDLKEAIELRRPEADQWKLDAFGEPRNASATAVKEVLDTLKAERQIKKFIDVSGDEAKKKDAELGLDSPVAEIKLWLEPPAQDDKDKKSEPTKDVKPAVAIAFGAVKDDLVYAKSTTDDGLVTRFAVPKTMLEKITPKAGALAFLDATVPAFAPDAVRVVTRIVQDQKTELVKDEQRWQLVNAKETTKSFAGNEQVIGLLAAISHLKATEWLKQIDAKTDLAEFGLNAPTLQVIVRVKEKELKPATCASIAGLAVTTALGRPFLSASAILGLAAGQEDIVYKFGTKTDKDGKEETYGLRSGSNLLFRVAASEVAAIKQMDLRDRFWLTHLEPLLDASLVGMLGRNVLLAASPLVTHQVAAADVAQVKELRVALRTPSELRRFTFVRKDDKTWQTGLEDFDLDSAQVNQLVEKLSQLRAASFVRLQGGPLPDQKLNAKEATVQLELLRGDGKTEFALTVGAKSQAGYYAVSRAWPEAVFTLPAAEIDPLLRGAAYFGKTGVALQ